MFEPAVVAKIWIEGTEPQVQRTLELPAKLNLGEFHDVLVRAFGWNHYAGPHVFEIGAFLFGRPEKPLSFKKKVLEATSLTLGDICSTSDAFSVPMTFKGGSAGAGCLWVFAIELTPKQHEINPDRKSKSVRVFRPRCVEAAGIAPTSRLHPTDYAEFLRTRKDPRHPDELTGWWFHGQKKIKLCEKVTKEIRMVIRYAYGGYSGRYYDERRKEAEEWQRRREAATEKPATSIQPIEVVHSRPTQGDSERPCEPYREPNPLLLLFGSAAFTIALLCMPILISRAL